jgi:hypothetical protein
MTWRKWRVHLPQATEALDIMSALAPMHSAFSICTLNHYVLFPSVPDEKYLSKESLEIKSSRLYPEYQNV